MTRRNQVLLALIFFLALFLRLFRVGLDGYSNLYYAATVHSMLTGWHNFFFASFDSAGFVSVDKPPLGFWVQALSAAIFGFHGWALVLPQALAGALSVLVLYLLVKRVFGSEAGLLAGLILAVTPISVATHRSNTPDGQLLLVLLLAALFASKAAESGKLRWLAASAAMVGLGFNLKMLQAYLVVPGLFFLLPSPLPLLKRAGQLAIAMAILFSLSFAWPMAVDLTPASARPYVGSSATNHVMELVAVHNGVRRLGPIAAWFGIRPRDSSVSTSTAANQVPSQATIATAQPTGARAWPDGGLAEVGQAGLLRLFNRELVAQVSWLLPMALLALVAGVLRIKWKPPLGPEAIFHVLWAGWLFPALFFFSYGGLIHRYYLDMLAPPVAALCAAGLVRWRRDLAEAKRSGWLLPVAVALTSAFSLFIISYHVELHWLAWPVLVLGLLALAGIIFFRRQAAEARIYLLVLPAILLGPLVWSTTPMWKGGDVTLPFAGPDLIYWGGEGNVMEAYRPLADFLVQQRGGEKFVVATRNAVVGAPLELLTGQPVMALGGFTGADPILTIDELQQLTAAGEVRFLLEYHEDPVRSERIRWAAARCQLVSFRPIPQQMDLYDCRPR